MRFTSFLPVAVGLMALLWPSARSMAQGQSAARPNILFVMTDDQAPWALGASGHPYAKTPNMDRLAREGAYLKNAFCVTPVCSPSRASLMTSRYGSELGITDWINAPREPDLGLNPSTVTWPEILEQAGYRTGLVGKWHLGDKPQYHPTKHGYAFFAGFLGGGTTPKDPTLEIEGRQQKVNGYTYDILTDQAIEFLRAGESDQRPFALSLHFRAPHAPYAPFPESDAAPFNGVEIRPPNPDYPKLDIPRVKRLTREYLSSVHGVDRNLGRLLSALDELGIAENTLVIFTSDHGYNMGHNGIWHKGNGHWIVTDPPPATKNIPRNQRPNMYDNSLRVPCLVRWPAVIKPGAVITHTVTHLDWYPTLIAAAQAKPQTDTLATIRGRNVLPLLRGDNLPWEDDLYAEYSTHHQSRTHMRAYRTPKWKLVRDFLNPGRDEFYDLAADPAEAKNLIQSPRGEVQQAIADVHGELLAQMRQLNDPVLKSVTAQRTPVRLKVSDNRRFLVTNEGKPFFYLGDTAWELFHRLDREQADRYLEDRAAKGFTVIQAVALAELDGLNDPNPYGHRPLVENDPTRPAVKDGPDNDYWDHVDYIVQKANSLGLVVGMLPTWGDKWNKKWGVGPEIFTPANAEIYGRWLGKRYAKAGIIWIVGGDRPIENDAHRQIVSRMAKGLRQGDGGAHLCTFHPTGGHGSAEYFHDADWLDFNMRQNGHVTEFTGRYEQTRADYDRRPIKPVVDGEPIYEDHPISFKAKELGHSVSADVRRPLYWNLFSGAFGHTYGHHSVWQMWAPGKNPINNPLMPWSEAIEQPGAGQMQHGRALIESRPVLTRIPDDSVIVTDRVATSVPGAGRYQFKATRDEAGTYAMVYVPVGRVFRVRMEVIRGPKVRAWWFNPRDGKATQIGEFTNDGEREFIPPEPGEQIDWVLVLDDAAQSYPPPGAKTAK